MGPLGFVNWRVVNARFCSLMWAVAAVLAVILLMHVGAHDSVVRHGVATAGMR